MQPDQEPEKSSQGRDSGGRSAIMTEPRWWQTLAFRLGLMINMTALVVLIAFWLLDYRREWTTHMEREAERLREEGRVLAAARVHLTDNQEFAEFVDTFCRQMQATVSPDHHILVLDVNGAAIATSRAHTGHALEAELLRRPHPPGDHFVIHGISFLSVAVQALGGEQVVVTQSLKNIAEIIRSQSISRLASLAMLAMVLFGSTTVALLVWVRVPLRLIATGVAELGRRNFAARVHPRGSAELRYVASGVNSMAAALEVVDKERQSQIRRARDIQSRLLPRVHEVQGNCEIATFFEPADGVGGDFYDIVPVGKSSTLIMVLDVSGHGVAPALYTALLRTVLRHEARLTSDPGKLLELMNRELAEVAVHSGDFATCFLCRIDAEGSTIHYASAGHEPALLITPNGDSHALAECGTPLGVCDAEQYEVASADFQAGTRLLLYTDGLHEVANTEGELFGRDRLVEAFASTRLANPSDQVSQVVSRVRAFATKGRFLDDVTVLSLCRSLH